MRPAGPELHAVWNVTTSSGPRRTTARPGTISRQLARRGRANDVDGVVAIVEPQRDPDVGVRPDVVVHHAGRPLGGEHEVDAEAAAALGHADE